jgi:UDP-glucuronate 4-epimerase
MCRFSNYVDDLVRDIHLLVEAVDEPLSSLEQIAGWDSLSPVDPFRIVNIGNASKVRHLDYLGAIKEIFVKKEFRNFINMQKSDEPET